MPEFDRDPFDYLLEDPAEEPAETTVETPPSEPQEQETETPEPENPEETTENEDDLDAFSSFLKSRGVRDGKTLIYIDEDTNEEQEVDFYSLSKEDQLNVLNSLADPGLTDDEIETINWLRKNQTTFQDVIAYYQQKAVEDYKNQNGSQTTYSVDDYSDDEIYAAELKARYPEMTDEEIQSEVETAKVNEDLFKKKVDRIRTQYKELEESQIKEAEEAQKAQQEAYQNTFVESLNNFSEISLDYKDPKSERLELEQRDKAMIYDYVFKQNAEGVTKFVEDLSKPEVIIELAWYRLFGKDAMSDISKYWKDELKKAHKAAKKEEPKQPKSTTTVIPPKENEDNGNPHSMWDKLL